MCSTATGSSCLPVAVQGFALLLTLLNSPRTVAFDKERQQYEIEHVQACFIRAEPADGHRYVSRAPRDPAKLRNVQIRVPLLGFICPTRLDKRKWRHNLTHPDGLCHRCDCLGVHALGHLFHERQRHVCLYSACKGPMTGFKPGSSYGVPQHAWGRLTGQRSTLVGMGSPVRLGLDSLRTGV